MSIYNLKWNFASTLEVSSLKVSLRKTAGNCIYSIQARRFQQWSNQYENIPEKTSPIIC
jgi:hypothetical protein